MMGTFIKLAWRNLFRNKRRTAIAGSAIGIGLASMIFVDALIIGMEENMVRGATSSFMGEAQIHRRHFRDTYETDKTIHCLDEVIAGLRSEAVVEDFTLRTLSFGMIASPANVGSATLVGVDPRTEKSLSQIDDAIVEGDYFEGEAGRDILIGSKLAEILKVDVGDRIVATVARVRGGDLSQEMFRVSGIYHLGIAEMDRDLAFIRIEKAREMLGIGRSAHQIAVKFDRSEASRDADLPFWAEYSQYNNEAVSWTELLPEMEAAFRLSRFSIMITGLILFSVIALGIINTLFMSIHERMFEFGVLRAVGTRPTRLVLLIVLEAGGLAWISIVLGTLLGGAVTWITAKTGIDYRGIEMGGVALRDLLYPVMTSKQYIIYPLAVFILTSMVALYPALHAARIAPAESMRRSM